jgi:hypothetical protein
VLELIRPGDNGRLQVLLSTDVFGVIRSLAAFRLTGAQRDYIIVGSDSGRIVILDYNKDKNTFVKVRAGLERAAEGDQGSSGNSSAGRATAHATTAVVAATADRSTSTQPGVAVAAAADAAAGAGQGYWRTVCIFVVQSSWLQHSSSVGT